MSSKKYENMTRKERRAAIAKDVINTINAKKFREIRPGNYVYFRGLANAFGQAEFDQDNAPEMMPKCTVCARGAMMLCKIEKYNGDTVNLFYASSETTREVLKDAFSERELYAIETAFERFNNGPVRAREFGEDFSDPEDRLIATMQNIIDHDGTFTPRCRYVMK
jgi:activator of 2-hydroxyglutaryl-CoA dehydratase